MVVWESVTAVAVGINGGGSCVGAWCGEDKVTVSGDLAFDVGHELDCSDGVVIVVVGAGKLVSDTCDGVDGVVVYGDGASLFEVRVVGVFVVIRDPVKLTGMLGAFRSF